MTHSDDALLPLDAVRPPASSKDTKGAVVAAPERPVARVVVDSPLPHLDRLFDYLVPAAMHEAARPGVRVRVRFAGKLIDAFLLERVDESEHEGKLTPLERVVSPEQVLTPEIAGLARAVADRYAGTLTDVLRLAVPPRHAKAEAEVPPPADPAPPPVSSRAPSREAAQNASPAVDRVAPSASSGVVQAAGAPEGPEVAGSPSAVVEEAATGDGLVGETFGEVNEVEERQAADTAADVNATTAADAHADVDAANAEAAHVGAAGAANAGAVTPTRSGQPGASAGAVGGQGGVSELAKEGRRSAWDAYPTGPSFLDALRHGRAPRAVWSALPGATGWTGAMAEAVLATLDGGRGAVLVVPDGKDVALADAEFERLLGPGRHVALTADLGPAERYRRWLKVLRGQVRAVVGTRAAMFAPVADLGLVAIWDDGDDLHAERLAPYPHAREVLGLRAHRTGAAMLIGGYARTAEATQLIATRWARPIVAARAVIRSLAPRVRPAGEDAELAKDQAARQARLPSLAWRALRQGLESGPVLVQVPRRGYLPALACRHCRAPARCVLPPTRIAPHLAAPLTAAGAPTAARGEADTRSEAGARSGAGVRGDAGARGGGEGQGGPTPVAGEPLAMPVTASGLVTASGPVPLGLPFQVPGGSTAPGTGGGALPPAADGMGGMPEGPGAYGGGESLCHGPLALRAGHAAPYCRWCGRVDADWRCPSCGSPRLRAVVTGARRTAEELGRAFPSVPVRTSGRDGVLARVPAARALVVATPGAEPVAEGGYAAAVLLDGWALLGRADLRAGEETLRRWMNAAALLRPSAELVVLGDAGLPSVQALLRWDPITHAERELGDRAELGFPPAVRMATLTGSASAVRQMLDEVRLPPDAQVLGPVPVDESGLERAMIRVRRGGGAALSAALKGASGVRAARKTPDVVRVSVDPLDLI
ncbi:primosomal protein N' [Nonomuraea sp. NPDC052265]|uniref:primosomal protein N' n=1 Tax=Nonomuraea sp. NPDC052265 TaxID=3364374 RepID=UPI0037C5145B